MFQFQNVALKRPLVRMLGNAPRSCLGLREYRESTALKLHQKSIENHSQEMSNTFPKSLANALSKLAERHGAPACPHMKMFALPRRVLGEYSKSSLFCERLSCRRRIPVRLWIASR